MGSSYPNRAVNELSASGAIEPKAADNYFAITKATAAALTLALPTVDGQSMRVQDAKGAAHTITVPIKSPPDAGLNGTKARATFDGNVGSFVDLVSYNGSWYVGASSGVTVA